jgi:hypothetical protein
VFDGTFSVGTVVSGISVALPNGQIIIISTHTATLNLPTLPLSARAAHIFQSLQGSLLCIGMLTDAGLTAIYNSDAVTIHDAMRWVSLCCPATDLRPRDYG